MSDFPTLKARWTGFRPLVMHNGALADPENKIVLDMRKITSKGSKKTTPEDLVELARLEWLGGLYWDENDGMIIPSDNIERCIQLGAQKSRNGKDVQAAVFCVAPHAKIEHAGPKTKDKLQQDPRFSLRKGVVIKKSRVFRVRPMVPTGWSITFELQYDSSIIGRNALIKAMQDAGALVGLGDWRPKFGRFSVEVIE